MKTKFSLSTNLSKVLVIFIFLSSCSKANVTKIEDLSAGVSTSVSNQVEAPCLVPFYRYWNNGYKDHFYTVAQGNYTGYIFEKIECTVNACPQGNWKPFYRYWNKSRKDHFYTTTQGTYTGWAYEGIECYVLLTPPPAPTSVIPLYKYWNSGISDHYYTVTLGNYAGYVYEGIACYVEP